MIVNSSQKKKENIDEHVAVKHTDNEDEEVKYLCIECKEEFDDVEGYEEHVDMHTSKTTELKYLENLVFTTILENYIDNPPKDDGLVVLKEETIVCTKCALAFASEKDMKTHMQTAHAEVKVFLNRTTRGALHCEMCDYVCKLNIQMKKHLENQHTDLNYGCDLCGFRDNFVGNIWMHKIHKHDKSFQFNKSSGSTANDLMLNLLAEQNSNLMDEVNTLKNFIKEAFENFTNEFVNIVKVIQDDEQKKNMQIKEELSNLKKNVALSDLKVVSPIQSVLPDLPSSPEPIEQPRKTSQKKHTKTEYQKRKRVLIVGDSLVHSADFRRLERATNSTIKTAHAYSSASDNTARSKDNNIMDVKKMNSRKLISITVC